MKKIGKKGYASINLVISVLVMLSCFSLLIEMTDLGKKYVYMPETATFITRTLSHQGGITTSTPSGYPDPDTYLTSRALFQKLNDQFQEEGFSSWSLYVNDRKLTNFSSITIPERERIDIRLEGSIKPQFKSLWRNKRNIEIQTERTAYSSFTPRQDSLTIIK